VLLSETTLISATLSKHAEVHTNPFRALAAAIFARSQFSFLVTC
jgi:hypothetical protein